MTADGKEVLTFDRAYDAALTGTLLVLTTPEEFAYSPALHHAAGDCRVLDLATGEELTVPENAYGCRISGRQRWPSNLCNAPAQALCTRTTWGDDLTRLLRRCRCRIGRARWIYQADAVRRLSSFYCQQQRQLHPHRLAGGEPLQRG